MYLYSILVDAISAHGIHRNAPAHRVNSTEGIPTEPCDTPQLLVGSSQLIDNKPV